MVDDLKQKHKIETEKWQAAQAVLQELYEKKEKEAEERQGSQVALQAMNNKLESEAALQQVAQEGLQDLNDKLQKEVEERQESQAALQDLNSKLENAAAIQQTAQEGLQELNIKLENEVEEQQENQVVLQDQNIKQKREAVIRQATQKGLESQNHKLKSEAEERQAAQEGLQDLYDKLEKESAERQAAQAALEELNTELVEESEERQAAQEALEANTMELQKSQTSNLALINAIPDRMYIIRRNGNIVYYKEDNEQVYKSPKQFLGKTVFEGFTKDIAVLTMERIEQAFTTGEVQVFEYNANSLGKVNHYEVRVAVSAADEVMVICRNITDRILMEEQLKFQSLHDSLTKLYNRTYFEEQMKLNKDARECIMGLIICDVDGLKIVNDALGHPIGDFVLKNVASILKESFRPEDIVARIGGDEFAVLLKNCSIKALETSCHRVREGISNYNIINPTIPISLSMGYAVNQRTPIDTEALFKEADNNMYREKLHQQKSARNSIVQALIKALEARDFITEGHAERLQWLVEKFAKAIGIPEQSLADIRLLARFHDIGKVGIPDSILFKPGRLTKNQWVVMKRHCEIGYRIAMASPDLAPIADGVLKHQEWWDGTGYPLKIAGENIPIECRMLAIVDAYDAMTNDRPYRKAMSQKEAIKELGECAGTQFDPGLVKEFVAIMEAKVPDA
jgi:diguanylate cyclase (GGDEF)-like protein